MKTPMQTAIEVLEGRYFKQSRLNANHYILNDAGKVVDARLSPSMGFSLSGPLEALPALLSPSPSPSLALHPSEYAFLEKAITDALAELDKLGQPHRIGCNLAAAWGLLKGRLQQQHVQSITPTAAAMAPSSAVLVMTCPACRDHVGRGQTCKCGAMKVSADGSCVTYTSTSTETVYIPYTPDANGNGGNER